MAKIIEFKTGKVLADLPFQKTAPQCVRSRGMLIKGVDLTPKQIEIVKAAFVHRNTVEWPFPMSDGDGSKTDAQWISEHAFHFTKDGSRLMLNKRYAEPAFMAD